MIVTIYPFINTIVISFNAGLDTIRGGIYCSNSSMAAGGVNADAIQQNMVTPMSIRAADACWYDYFSTTIQSRFFLTFIG